MAARRVVGVSSENSDIACPTSANRIIDNKAKNDALSNGNPPDSFLFSTAFADNQNLESAQLHNQMEYRLREMRATAFALAARDCHPDDARQLATALLIDLSAGMPTGAIFGSIREDAKWWAGLATPAELLEVLGATLETLRSRAMHRAMRKKLFMILWRSFMPKEQSDFLTFAKGGVRNDH